MPYNIFIRNGEITNNPTIKIFITATTNNDSLTKTLKEPFDFIAAHALGKETPDNDPIAKDIIITNCEPTKYIPIDSELKYRVRNKISNL